MKKSHTEWKYTKNYVQNFKVISQTLALVVAPIAAPEAGIKKSLALTRPSVPRAPFRVDASVLLKEASFQVSLLSHEFPEAETLLFKLT